MSNPIENGHAILTEEYGASSLPLEPDGNIDWAAWEQKTEEVLRPPDRERLDADSPFKQMMHHPLLTHQQELALGRQIQAGKTVSPNHPDYENIRAAGLQARDALVNHNYRLAGRWALGKSITCHIPVMDLFQEACIGMMTAAKKFDPDRNLKFSTYASWWINQAITRAIQEQSTIIRKPTHVREIEWYVLQAADSIYQQNLVRRSNGETPLPNTYDAIAEKANEIRTARRITQGRPQPKSSRNAQIKEGRVRGVLLGGRVTYSLDMPVPFLDDDTTAEESFVDKEAEPVEELAVRNAFSERVQSLIDELPPRERVVVRARFGLDSDGEEKTLEQIGQMFGVTRERARQILKKATERLHKRVKAKMLWE